MYTLDFRYLPSATTKQDANEMRVIAIKLSKTNPPKKTTETKGENFSVKIVRCRDEPIKRMETRQRQKHTGRLPHYRNMEEKKNTQKTTLHLLLVHVTDAG